MLHRRKTIKFKNGQDAKEMLIKKLVRSLLLYPKITLTLTKAKVLKQIMEKLVEKAKRENEANKNYLLRYTTDSQLVKIFFTKIGPAAKERQGGYLRIKKIGERASDGAEMAILEWTIAQK
jgi:large subunit ribosomal protein L17